ncbi:MAG: hypothetical protein KBB50_01440 [Candidatus Pacebacteria bacterium]|nr:hypothetical protein [Candidatus Paceibacterota bacterium]
MKKIKLYITDLQLHARTFRPAEKFIKTIKSDQNGNPFGRIYGNNEKPEVGDNGVFRFSIPLPDDLQEQISKGLVEVEIVTPSGGVPIHLSQDTVEKIVSLEKKKLRKISRTRYWRK